MIDKILNIKELNYASSLNGDNLKQKIEDLFERPAISFFGNFTSQTEFAAYDKLSVISWYVPNFKRKSAYLKGEILKSGKGTLIKLNIRPNTMLSVASIVSVLVGIIILIAAGSSTRFLIVGSFFILVGILYYSFGIFSRNRLRTNFEKTLDLHKV
ncbi:hypothetical protein [Gelidibacter pelagius]|uniref:Uncharacterized protein n=1 Tax=Gelidibacter pelagius TaxID=2819985 RepID=A0ABS3SWB5_9FLAO|nr:hypothetical protein [Gelidibacter pelagius]MBO3100020.1 hypothetical protein [Gelidibacter pelagius]